MAAPRTLLPLLLLCLFGCGNGAATTSSPEASAPQGSDAAGPGDDGAGGSDAPPGDGGQVACLTGTVNVALHLAPGTTTGYCLGQGGGCGGDDWLSIVTAQGAALGLIRGCVADCANCQPVACTKVCAVPGVLGDAGATSSWDGTYQQPSTCGSSSLACSATECAPAGQYVAHMCVYAESPDAAFSYGCTNRTPTTPTCVDVPFTWPPDGGTTTLVGVVGGSTDAGAGD